MGAGGEILRLLFFPLALVAGLRRAGLLAEIGFQFFPTRGQFLDLLRLCGGEVVLLAAVGVAPFVQKEDLLRDTTYSIVSP